MRNQWRLLLQRFHSKSQTHISGHLSHPCFQVRTHPLFSIRRSEAPCLPHRPPLASLLQNFSSRSFSSSELAVEQRDSDQVVILIDIFSNQDKGNNEIKLELESNNICITHEMILKALQSLDTAPGVARRFFGWVSEVENERLSSKSYNLMLRILCMNGFVKEFWDLVGIMKKNGYGVSKGTFDRVLEKFDKDGLGSDVEKLKELYASGSAGNSTEKFCSRVCNVIRAEVWGDDVEKKLLELNAEYSSGLVEEVLKNLAMEPNKGLIFFRWIEESGLFKHDEKTYNAMAMVLGREDSVDKFWRVVDEMRGAGYEMQKETYVQLLGRFIKRKMIKDAVYLYEFAMGGKSKPSVPDCTFLLKKIVVSQELDMDLFSRVVRACKDGGYVLTNTTLDAVFKSLTSVGRFQEYNKILRAMEDGGVVPSDPLKSKIAFQLSSHGKNEEVSQLINDAEASGCKLSYKMGVSLVEGYCVADDLDKASDCFRQMMNKEGISCAGFALELLVDAYCRKNRATDMSKLLSDMLNQNEFKPWHSTYKLLTKKLLVQGGFVDALSVLVLMKRQGYPPFLDPFLEYISRNGSYEDAVAFFKAVTVKRFPSTSVFLHLFEAYLKAGRHNEAQDLLSKCPKYVRNNADVLNLFCSMKSGKAAVCTDIAA